MIDLTYPHGALDAEQRVTLTDRLTTILLRAKRAPDTEFLRSITWTSVHELPARDVLVAGRLRFEQLRQAAAQQRDETAAAG